MALKSLEFCPVRVRIYEGLRVVTEFPYGLTRCTVCFEGFDAKGVEHVCALGFLVVGS